MHLAEVYRATVAFSTKTAQKRVSLAAFVYLNTKQVSLPRHAWKARGRELRLDPQSLQRAAGTGGGLPLLGLASIRADTMAVNGDGSGCRDGPRGLCEGPMATEARPP
jgi:hypothetical protein